MSQLLLLCFILASASVSLTMASAPSPYSAQAPLGRKMGKHQNAPTALSPSNEQFPEEAEAPESEDSVSILEQLIHLKKHHADRSVAGGGVILGGLATTFLVAIFCYIRATTRHKKPEIASPQVN